MNPAMVRGEIHLQFEADFIPNDTKNPARKMRIQKVTEYGAFCINEWKDQCMYAINCLASCALISPLSPSPVLDISQTQRARSTNAV